MATKVKPKPSANGVHAPAPEVLTLAEAAEFLRVAETGLLADVVAGRIPARQVAGEWRFGRAPLMVWLGEIPAASSSKARLRAVIGTWKDDPTVDPMIARIEADRRADSVGG